MPNRKYTEEVTKAAVAMSDSGMRHYDIIPALKKKFPREKALRSLNRDRLNQLIHAYRKETGTLKRRNGKKNRYGRKLESRALADARRMKFQERLTYEAVSEKINGKYGTNLKPGEIRKLLHPKDGRFRVTCRGTNLMFDLETDEKTAFAVLRLVMRGIDG